MIRTAFLAVSFTLLIAPVVSSQNLVPSSMQQTNPIPVTNTGSSAPAPELSPRQMLELRGDIFVARKMYLDAIHTYEQVLAQDPKNALVLNKIGVAYQQLGNYPHAERYYKRAVKADKTFSTSLNNLGTIQYDHQNYRKAARYYKQAIRLHPEVATYFSNLGYAYYSDKRYTDAMDAFQQATQLDPNIFEHKGGTGAVIQQRSMVDPGMFYFMVAKTYALAGDAEHCAHFLTIARDEGYKLLDAAQKDPSFAKVIKDPRVQAVFQLNDLADAPHSPS
ncbi:MAG: tetratricopeptide repeat protein [Candidatus Acidiferrales bacterium]